MNCTFLFTTDKVFEALIDLTNKTMNLTTVSLNLEERLGNSVYK